MNAQDLSPQKNQISSSKALGNFFFGGINLHISLTIMQKMYEILRLIEPL